MHSARGLLHGSCVVESVIGAGRRNGTRPNVIWPVTLTLPATAGFTITLTVEAALVAPRLSVTTSEKVNVVAVATVGAANVGMAAVALVSVMAGAPAVCVHA